MYHPFGAGVCTHENIFAYNWNAKLPSVPKIRAMVTKLVRTAIDGGVIFFDNCWEYHRGKTEAWMGNALKGVRSKVFLMTKM